MNKIIYYDKLFPLLNNNSDIYKKIKIDNKSISYISSPQYAEKITKIIRQYTKSDNIIITDCTAGCGGDTISFLNTFKRVYSIEKNLIRYNYLLNNIKSYNLEKNSRIYCGDFLKIIFNIYDHNVLYIDPPWGGCDYKQHKFIDIYINNILLEDFLFEYINKGPKKKNHKIPEFIILKLPINYNLQKFYYKLKDFGKIFLHDLKKMLILVIELDNKYVF
jgi:16S rRNA G966 N2-methylase RsmD